MTIPDRSEAAMLIGSLTPKQLEIVKAITRGATCNQVCTSLGIAPGTYQRHKHEIRIKMAGRPVWGWPAILLSVIPLERVRG